MKKIVILAAGKGTRMGADVPKVLVPLQGRPMIQHLLDSIYNSGLDMSPIIVSSPDIIDQTKHALRGYHVSYAIQEKQLGTGDALASACKVLPEGATSIITFYGDHPLIQSETMIDLARRHEMSSSPVTIMTVQVGNFDMWPSFIHWGRIIRDGENKISEIIEYKDATDEQKVITEVNPAIYCFDKEWLCKNIEQISNDNAQGEYYLTDLVEIAFSQGFEIQGTQVLPAEAIGVNTKEELSIAQQILQNT